MPYSPIELENALTDVWELLEARSYDSDDLKKLTDKHPVLAELMEYGPNGPVGLGLGRVGGHAVANCR